MKLFPHGVLTVALGILLLYTGCTIANHPATEVNGSQKRIVASDLFNQYCAKCHGKDGRAKTIRGRIVGAQDFTDPEWQATTTDGQMLDAVNQGPKGMPSFEKKLSPSEISALVAYVRLFKPL